MSTTAATSHSEQMTPHFSERAPPPAVSKSKRIDTDEGVKNQGVLLLAIELTHRGRGWSTMTTACGPSNHGRAYGEVNSSQRPAPRAPPLSSVANGGAGQGLPFHAATCLPFLSVFTPMMRQGRRRREDARRPMNRLSSSPLFFSQTAIQMGTPPTRTAEVLTPSMPVPTARNRNGAR